MEAHFLSQCRKLHLIEWERHIFFPLKRCQLPPARNRKEHHLPVLRSPRRWLSHPPSPSLHPPGAGAPARDEGAARGFA